MSSFQSCCGFPHGQSSVFALVLGAASFFLALSSSWGCYFATVDFILIDDSPVQMNNFGGMGIGLFSHEDKTAMSEFTCKTYSTEQLASFDNAFKTARICGIVANALIGTGMLCLLPLSCMAVRKSVIQATGYMLVLGGLVQSFTLLFFKSDVVCYDCEFFFGAALSLLCMVVTLVNAIVVTCYLDEACIKCDEDDDDGGELYDQTISTDKGQIEIPIPMSVSSEDSEDTDDSRSIRNNPATPQHYKSRPPPTTRPPTRHSRPKRQIVTATIVHQDGNRTVEETTFRNKERQLRSPYLRAKSGN